MRGIDDFGRDDGIRCKCGAGTFLVFDQGHGLCSYECNNEDCDELTTVQFDLCDDEDLEGNFDEPYPDDSMEEIEDDDPECE